MITRCLVATSDIQYPHIEQHHAMISSLVAMSDIPRGPSKVLTVFIHSSQQFDNKRLPDFTDLPSHRYCKVCNVVCNYSIRIHTITLNMHYPSTMETFTHYYSLHMHISKDLRSFVIRFDMENNQCV